MTPCEIEINMIVHLFRDRRYKIAYIQSLFPHRTQADIRRIVAGIARTRPALGRPEAAKRIREHQEAA